MSEIDLKFMKGNKDTLKAMCVTYIEKTKNKPQKSEKKTPKK